MLAYLEYIQADVTLLVHVGVVTRCGELHNGRGVRVAAGEGQRQFVA